MQYSQEILRMARYLQLAADLACLINNTDRGFFDGNVQTGIMLPVVLLLMLEAIHPDLVLPSA